MLGSIAKSSSDGLLLVTRLQVMVGPGFRADMYRACEDNSAGARGFGDILEQQLRFGQQTAICLRTVNFIEFAKQFRDGGDATALIPGAVQPALPVSAGGQPLELEEQPLDFRPAGAIERRADNQATDIGDDVNGVGVVSRSVGGANQLVRHCLPPSGAPTGAAIHDAPVWP